MNTIKQYLFGLVAIVLIFACSSKAESNQKAVTATSQPSTVAQSSSSPSLKSELDKKKAAFAERADEKTKTLFKAGIDAVRESGVLEQAKMVGQQAPNFSLTNAVGENVELADYLKKGPVVLTWYRGGWCPYCNLTLKRLQDELPNIKAQGANLLALTPEVPDSSITTTEKHHLEFEVLSDLGNKVAKEYGIVFELIPEVAEIYNKAFNLNKYNGDASNELPLAATFIINQKGEITYAFVDPDYRNRAEPSELVEVLAQMKKASN